MRALRESDTLGDNWPMMFSCIAVCSLGLEDFRRVSEEFNEYVLQEDRPEYGSREGQETQAIRMNKPIRKNGFIV